MENMRKKETSGRYQKNPVYTIILILLFVASSGILTLFYLNRAADRSYLIRELFPYADIPLFEEDLLCVKKDGKYGYLNIKGETIIDFRYDDAYAFVNGLASVKTETGWSVIDTKGKPIFEETYDDTYVDDDGVIVYKKNSLFGLMDPDGNILTEAIYSDIYEFSEGIAVVKIQTDEPGVYEYGYLDKQGKLIYAYLKAFRFLNGLGLVYGKRLHQGILENRYYFIDREGRDSLNQSFTDAYPFFHDLAVVSIRTSEGKNQYGIINKKGDTVVDFLYDEIIPSIGSGNFIAKKDNLYYLISESGKVLNQTGYLSLSQSDFRPAYFLIAETADGTRKIINPDNKTIIADLSKVSQYLYVPFYSPQYFSVRKDTISTLYNRDGNEVLSYECDTMLAMEDRIIIQKNGKYGAIDFRGRMTIDIVYDSLLYQNGYALALSGSKFGLLDSHGKIIIPFQYDEIRYDSGKNTDDLDAFWEEY